MRQGQQPDMKRPKPTQDSQIKQTWASGYAGNAMGMPTPVVAAPTDQESSNKEPLDAKTIRWHPDAKRRDTCFSEFPCRTANQLIPHKFHLTQPNPSCTMQI
jgi:hypothetical protein